jgi:hypothetical protein
MFVTVTMRRPPGLSKRAAPRTHRIEQVLEDGPCRDGIERLLEPRRRIEIAGPDIQPKWVGAVG